MFVWSHYCCHITLFPLVLEAMIQQNIKSENSLCVCPECKNTMSVDKDGNKIIRPKPTVTDQKCEKCGKPMLIRYSRHGPFLACSGFPKCRNTKKISPEGVNPAEPQPSS